MIPEERISSNPIRGRLLNPWSRNSRVSLHRGPVAISDPSRGLAARLWRLRALADGLYIGPVDSPVESLLVPTSARATECSLAFDQLGRPAAAFVEGGVPKLYWYDSVVGEFVVDLLPTGVINPRLTLDDARQEYAVSSDIILAYVRDGSLYYRQQRDRYTIERLLSSGVSSLEHVSMNSVYRLQFVVDGSDGFGDDWTLGELLEDLCRSALVPADRVLPDQQLFDETVIGFATSPDYSTSEAVKSLAQVYQFDLQDADGVIRFVTRGMSSIATITEDQFVDGEDEPEKDTTRDSISVPRLLHLSYYDIEGGQGPDKQFSERPVSPRVDAPTVISTPVVMTAERAAKAIAVQHRVMEERLRGQLVFGLSDQWIRLAVGDVVIVQYRGRSQRVMISRVEMMDGWQRYTCERDRQSAYTANVEPIPPAIPTPPPSRIVGPTRFAFADIPALSQAQDGIGYHAVTSGELVGWRGAVIEREGLSAQYEVVATDGTGTVMGTLLDPLPAASPYYPDETNVIRVELARDDDELESVSEEIWLSRANACAIIRPDGSAEIVQFREADEVSPGVWELRGLQRGRLNTSTAAHSAGATFAMLEGALFLPMGSEALNTTLTHRAYSAGNDPTTGVVQSRVWTGRSQREWAPTITRAERIGDDLRVDFIPRHRFGSDENPIASQHFIGWRVIASDGTSEVSTVTTFDSVKLDVTGFSNPIDVTVRGVNRLSGDGDEANEVVT